MIQSEAVKATALPPGYRLEPSEPGIFGIMWTAYRGDKCLGSCGGGSASAKSDKMNKRRAECICFEDFGRRCAKAGLVPDAD